MPRTKNLRALILAIALTGASICSASDSFQKTENGLRLHVQGMEQTIEFMSPGIVRILRTPENPVISGLQSLSVTLKPEKINLSTEENAPFITISSEQLKVQVDVSSGKIRFINQTGNVLLTEKEFGTQFTPVNDANTQTYLVRQGFLLDPTEKIYGLGQQQNGRLNQRGQRLTLKNSNTSVCIPFFQSSKGYGIFWDNYASTLFTDNRQETSFESQGGKADYYFMTGNTSDEIVGKMRHLTGEAPMLPLWSYGYWQSRERYRTQQELQDVVDKYRSLHIPLDGIVQDWRYWGQDSMWNAMQFDPKIFPDPKGMMEHVHKQHAHLMIVAWPGFGPKTDLYKVFDQKKMLIRFDTWPPDAGCKPYDPYNPEARDLYWNQLKKGIFDLGPDAWWLDSSEPDHINVKEEDFDQPTYLGTYRSVVNAFPLEHVKGVYEHQRQTTSDKRVVILTRSAFAGQQRFGANTWSGDIVSSWNTLQKQIPAALNFSMNGLPYWNADIGGFFLWEYQGGKALKNNGYRELYVRWVQFGAFTPMMRSHGTDAPREIYQFGKAGETEFDAIARTIRLRYRMLPYIYSTAWNVSNQHGSFMRPLFADFPQDSSTFELTDQYLFGQSLLVAPVVHPMYVNKQSADGVKDYSVVHSRQVYLPASGKWVDFWSGKTFTGGQTVQAESPIDQIPLFAKAGSILPFGPSVEYADEKSWKELEIRIFPGENGSFELYEDEKDNYNYEKGAYSTILFSWDDSSKSLTIHNRKGTFPGMIKKRIFRIAIVSPVNANRDQPAVVYKTVTYNGQNTTCTLQP